MLWRTALAGLLFFFPLLMGGYDPKAPWPCMRQGYLNQGRADMVKPSEIPDKDKVPFWEFYTQGPIYSTPIVGADGTIYVGSADGIFYALTPEGRLKWKFLTKRLIDSAGALSADGKVYLPSGDGNIYALEQETGRELWRFSARNIKRDKVPMANWFEGNITLRPDGLIMAGNDDFCVYFLKPSGELEGEFCSRGMVWSAVPTDWAGRNFFCSLDFFCYGLNQEHKLLWKKFTWGIVSCSPAVGDNGRVYITSFDGKIYALNPQTGRTYWSFKTQDHIYSSPAIGRDGTIYVGGADGTLYALIDQGNKPKLKWAFDTSDPIRSSPVIDGEGNIYFGNSAGVVYVLSLEGKRRWSLNLSQSDRNDINASPALGKRAFYLAMEDGRVLQIPYDYCLRPEMKNQPECNLNPEEDLPSDGRFFYWMSPGGDSLPLTSRLETLAGNVISLRLLLRKQGETIPAGIERGSVEVKIEPWFEHHISISLDHRFLNIVPEGFLEPGQVYRVRIKGRIREPEIKLLGHIWLSGGKGLGEFEQEFSFQALGGEQGFSAPSPLLFTFLSFYQPWIFPSIAQIGMDDLKFIGVPVEELDCGKWLFWMMLAEPDRRGGFRVSPETRIIFPAIARYLGDIVLIEARNFAFDHAGDRFGFKLLRISGRPGSEQKQESISKTSLYAEGKSLSMAGAFYNLPVFGTPLSGTARISFYQFSSPLPEGFKVSRIYQKRRNLIIEYDNFEGILSSEHHISVLLLEGKSKTPLGLDYPRATRHLTDSQGRIKKTIIKLPLKWGWKIKRIIAVIFFDGQILKKRALVPESQAIQLKKSLNIPAKASRS